MISHALISLTAAVAAMPVTTIQPALETLLVPPRGTAFLLESGMAATIQAAVGMTAVTVLANPECAQAAAVAATPPPKNRLVSRHARPRGLDIGCESWQVRTECW
jgi:hypothetical protein